MGENREIAGGPPSDQPERVYVALGKCFKKNVKNLKWSIRNFPDGTIVILHVHDPQERPAAPLGGKLYRSIFKSREADAPKQRSQEEMAKVIQQYLNLCATEKIKADKLVIEAESVERGILALVAQHDIRKLVMGAASDTKYDRKMKAPTSEKARHVKACAPPHCQIWFVCNGNQICTREPSPLHKMLSVPLVPSTNPFVGEEDIWRTPSSNFQVERSDDPSQLADNGLAAGAPARTLSLIINGQEMAGDDPENDRGSISFRQLAEAKLGDNSWAEEHKDRKAAEEKQRLLELLKEKDDRIAQLSREKAELETALAESERILKQTNEQLQASQSSRRESPAVPSFAEFTLEELQEATHTFDTSSQIGKGGFGAVYKGKIRHTTVAIKKLNSDSIQGATEFQQEVDILTRVRHPNLITLIGACSQAGCLVYEYLPNGSLEDRLLRRSRTVPTPSPLTWKERVRIAGQIYSALFFLHFARPYTIVHGDLKPANILLDANLNAKIGDFGICRLLPHQESAATIFRLTDPKGTYAYVDPQFMATGELTAKSDVYAFGVILLQLLTAKPGSGLANEVKKVLSSKKLHEILDPAAGKWPSKEAVQLANLGLHCCELERKNRPDLESDVWKVLQ
ncbi:U-box domain-containing protein 33-like [Nymphaea colorata]|nr:U-box domain-containing protein 33-like [Nymphaea colorata]